jgi:hypothetical protein
MTPQGPRIAPFSILKKVVHFKRAELVGKNDPEWAIHAKP